MGKKDLDSAENILGNCFTMQIIISVILTLIMFFGNRTFLMAFGASENTIEYAVSYMNIYSLGTIFVQLTLGMNAFITAQGFAKTGMYSVLIGAVINIILDPIFIFACHMGRSWCRTGYNHISGLFLHLGIEFLIWDKIDTSYQETKPDTESSCDPALSGSWTFFVYHAGK